MKKMPEEHEMDQESIYENRREIKLLNISNLPEETSGLHFSYANIHELEPNRANDIWVPANDTWILSNKSIEPSEPHCYDSLIINLQEQSIPIELNVNPPPNSIYDTLH